MNENQDYLKRIIDFKKRKFERILDAYLFNCKNNLLDEKFISELIKRMDAKLESTLVLKDKPNKKKILYELKDGGEIITDEDIIDGQIDRDITISSYKKDLQNDICFYVIHDNWPKEGLMFLYTTHQNESANAPEHLLGNDSSSKYVKEVLEAYSFRPVFLKNMGNLEFKLKEVAEDK